MKHEDPRFLGVIFAGGEASRYRYPKVLLTINGRPLLQYTYDALQAQGAHVAVDAGPGSHIINEHKKELFNADTREWKEDETLEEKLRYFTILQEVSQYVDKNLPRASDHKH